MTQTKPKRHHTNTERKRFKVLGMDVLGDVRSAVQICVMMSRLLGREATVIIN